MYIATRDLLIRHDRLSADQVERLKKRIEVTSVKLDGIRAAQRDNWLEEADRLTATIEKDQATIAAQLTRRIFIRAWCVSSTKATISLYLILPHPTACGTNFVLFYTTARMHF